MLGFLENIIMKDVVVEPIQSTTAAEGNGGVAGQDPIIWILLVLLLVVVALCFVFIMNNKRKKKTENDTVNDEQKGSH